MVGGTRNVNGGTIQYKPGRSHFAETSVILVYWVDGADKMITFFYVAILGKKSRDINLYKFDIRVTLNTRIFGFRYVPFSGRHIKETLAHNAKKIMLKQQIK